MKLEKTEIIEVLLTILVIASALILISGFPVYSYILVISTSLLSGIWLIKSIANSRFGRMPWYAFIFILPMAIIPIGLALKLSVIESGAFVLFIGLCLSLIAIAALFILVLTVKIHLKYLKNVSVRLVPAAVIGIVVYFTPQSQLIELVYAREPDRAAFLINKLEHPYESKERKRTIAFVTGRAGNSDIYEINPDGTGLKPLIEGNSNQWSPRISKDGKHLFYLDDSDSTTGIYRYNLINNETEWLKEIVFDDFYFQLHPFENKIISHDTIGGYFQLFLYDFDGKTAMQLTFDSSNNKKPVFMNDGNRIVFQSDRNVNSDLFILHLKNDSTETITKSKANDRNPAVSPYDDVILFHSDRDSLKYINLYYLVLNSGEIGQLTNSPGMELIGSFSPDAKDIVFGSNRDDNWEIYLMSNQGEFKDRLTNHPSFDGDAIYIERSYIKK